MIYEVIKDRFYIDTLDLDKKFSLIWIPGFPHLVDPGLKLTDSEFYYYSNSNGNLNSGQYIFEICPTSLESKHELMEYFIERGWKIRTIAQRNYLSGLVLDSVRKNCKKLYYP